MENSTPSGYRRSKLQLKNRTINLMNTSNTRSRGPTPRTSPRNAEEAGGGEVPNIPTTRPTRAPSTRTAHKPAEGAEETEEVTTITASTNNTKKRTKKRKLIRPQIPIIGILKKRKKSSSPQCLRISSRKAASRASGSERISTSCAGRTSSTSSTT